VVEAPAPVVEAPAPVAEMPQEFADAQEDVQQAPDRKMRHSVMAHDPDALRRIVHEDPKVAEAVKLFNGTVIDMHVM
jgi:hypothetical protein